MMTLIFGLYLVSMLLALKGKREWSFYSFALSLVVSAFWLSHHATDALEILL